MKAGFARGNFITYTEKNYKSVPNEMEFAVAKNNFLIEATYSVRWCDEQCSLARRTKFVDLIYKTKQ